jgi:hypothetical protein
MDPTALIVTALGAGAGSALQDETSAAVKDAYARLKAAVKKKFAGRSKGELVLAEYEAAPQMWKVLLAEELSSADVESDTELIAAAQALMSLVDEGGSESGKYLVTVDESQGVQVGNCNTQTNTFEAG